MSRCGRSTAVVSIRAVEFVDCAARSCVMQPYDANQTNPAKSPPLRLIVSKNHTELFTKRSSKKQLLYILQTL